MLIVLLTIEYARLLIPHSQFSLADDTSQDDSGNTGDDADDSGNSDDNEDRGSEARERANEVRENARN